MTRTLIDVWNDCLKVIKEHIPDQSFNTWFLPITPYKLVQNKLIIQVPSQFFYEFLENNYVSVLRKALDYSLGKDGQLEYTIEIDRKLQYNANATAYKKETLSDKTQPSFNQPNIQNPFEFVKTQHEKFDSYLNKDYTFDNYIEGDCNRLARAASFAVAQKPSTTSFNPLMIYGGVGLGKTHLIQAIGNYIEKTDDTKKVLYVSTEKFTSQFINAIRDNNLRDFMSFYMQVDILIIDDVQFLSGKEKTQETFFHIFNHLHQTGKQIIMTSDRPPRELSGLEDRLLSRFKWGLTADIQTPDLETRIAFIKNKVTHENGYMSNEVVEYLAHSIDSNIRELSGVVISLLGDAALTRREIDVEMARYRIKSIVEESDKNISIEKIIEEVTQFFNVKLSEIKGKSRLREVVMPRQIAMYLAKNYTEMSLKNIGYHFGGRDHSTVIHGIQTVND
ncbi:MAG: chromosomal replication initiator protein DnaA, partial [Leadbetterella sp.]